MQEPLRRTTFKILLLKYRTNRHQRGPKLCYKPRRSLRVRTHMSHVPSLQGSLQKSSFHRDQSPVKIPRQYGVCGLDQGNGWQQQIKSFSWLSSCFAGGLPPLSTVNMGAGAQLSKWKIMLYWWTDLIQMHSIKLYQIQEEIFKILLK